MKIKRLRIRAYRGIEELDTEIPATGVVIRGTNGSAKTSVLRAIQAALSGQDVGPEAIRLGHDRSEILINLDDLEVERILTAKGSKVSVERDFGGARAKIPSPAKFLKDLIGVSEIDPIDLLSADTAEKRRARRAKVLGAIPAYVTAEQIRGWTGEEIRVPDSLHVTHGLEVIAQLRSAYYDRRTEANARAKEARRKADELARDAAKLPEKPAGTPTAEDARKIRQDAERAVSALETRVRAAVEADERTKSTRARVEDLRKRAAAEVEGITAPTADELTKAISTADAWGVRVREIEDELTHARDGLAKAELHVSSLQSRRDQADAARRRSEAMNQQASDLESAISLASVQAPTERETTVAQACLHNAVLDLQTATLHEQNDITRQRAFDAEQAARATEAEADKLDRVVQKLTHDAPTELLASANGIRGLSVQGDQIFLDGVDFDGLCGREQLRFAVEIAKRANAKSKILIVDGLERISPENLDEFVRLATADDWQLISTRVEKGERVIEALEVDRREEGAAA